jgi:hypothetical protein
MTERTTCFHVLDIERQLLVINFILGFKVQSLNSHNLVNIFKHIDDLFPNHSFGWLISNLSRDGAFFVYKPILLSK